MAQQGCSNLKTLRIITEEKRSEIIRLYGQLKSLTKTAVQANFSKEKIIRVLKSKNRKTGKKTRHPEAFSVRDKKEN